MVCTQSARADKGPIARPPAGAGLRRGSATWALAALAALPILATASAARADEVILIFDGEVPDDGLDHFFVDFEVPEGTVEIEVIHDDLSTTNILDWGLQDPAGHRGWGGGNAEAAVVGLEAASRSYVPGPISAGTWRVVVGKAKVVSSPAVYHIEVILRDEATLAPQPERAPYRAAAPLSSEARWYAGDFHAHSRESGDAAPTLSEMATLAESQGLDFVVLTDHNVLTQLDFIGAAQQDHPQVLFVPGMEFTTYGGHANAIGLSAWVDHKIGQPGITVASAFEQLHGQGALVSINHPVLDIGDLCIGCAWSHDLNEIPVDAVEVATTGLMDAGALFNDDAVAWWDALCAEGRHVVPLGGSDDHKAGMDLGIFQSPIGEPTTLVWAEALSVEGLLAGLRAGRTVVKMGGPGDPMVEILASKVAIGDTLYSDEPVTYEVRSSDAEGFRLDIVVDGEVVSSEDVDAAAHSAFVDVDTVPGAERRVRAELWQADKRRVLTSHHWQRACTETLCSQEAGGDDDGTDGDDADTGDQDATDSAADDADATDATDATGADSSAHAHDSGGCACQNARAPSPTARTLLAAFLLGLTTRRRVRVTSRSP